MADKKISELTSASALSGTEQVAIVQSGATVKTTTQDIANLATPDLSGLVPYTGATSDVDLDTHILNAQSVNVKGTGGNGHVGLKHQSADATASASETVIFAGSDGEPRYKNDGGTVAQFASRAWVTAQGYITNVITALGYTPVPTTRTINGYDLSANRTLNASDVSAVASNSAITGATKTKITYDSKGLVTSGADATTADIADSTNKRYVTDSQLTVIGNTSNTNTGDETQATIISKLGYTPQAQFLSKLVFKDVYGGTTSSTSETILATFTILANELPNQTTLYFETLAYKTAATVNGTFRIRVNTSNTLVGATQLATWGMGGNTNLHSQARRRFGLTGGNIYAYPASVTQNTDIITSTSAETVVAADVTNALYFFVTFTANSSADTLNHIYSLMKNF